ncbi:hypothetical protein D3C80_1963150 [compost metagenome]
MMASAIKLYEHLGFKRAYETDIMNGETLVKGYRLDLLSAPVQDIGQPLSAAGS